ncbi:MAG: alkaline phosphatase, partial [Calditrichota bacterium]
VLRHASEAGLFLMIEGGAIDWANHSNQAGRLIEEMTDFNYAVEAVIAWVEANSNWDETLLIVTGDHETGYLWGPESGEPATWKPIVDNGAGNMPGAYYYSGVHTNSLVPFFAKGFGSERFTERAVKTDPHNGLYIDNTDIARVTFDYYNQTAPATKPSYR